MTRSRPMTPTDTPVPATAAAAGLGRRAFMALVGMGLGATIARAEEAPSPVGRWLAEDIGGNGVLDRLQTTLELTAEGRVSGSSGCNRYTGEAKVDGKAIQFGPLASTRMSCSPGAMDQETKFLAALEAARGWQADMGRRTLTLNDGAGKALVLFSAL
ncbi:META domain-containing protein [Xanthobacter sp. ZOL 2024]